MTREQFVKKHADEFLGKLMRAAAHDKTTALYGRWLTLQVAEIDGWLASLYDSVQREYAEMVALDDTAT